MGPMAGTGAGLEAGAGHALAQAAFFEEISLETAELLVEEIVRLMDEADEDVGDDLRWAGLEIGPIGLIGPI